MRFNSIEEMELAYYGDATQSAVAALGDNTFNFAALASGPISTSTMGVYNPIFGGYAWNQLNQEANALGMLKKIPWGKSGFRVKKVRSTSLPTAGIAETGALPTAAVPEYQEISYKPKLNALRFNNTEMQEFLVEEADDDNYASMSQLRMDVAEDHKEDMNAQLLVEFGTLASDKFESIDRITASSVEQAACGETTGDEDLYGVDRSANTWFNSNVSHNSNVDRDLSDGLIRGIIETIGQSGGQPGIIMTGWDTARAVSGLYQSQIRYNALGAARVAPSVNGIQFKEGIEAGVNVTTLYGLPMIVSKNVKVDTLSRMYFLDASNPNNADTPRLCLKVAKPTQYFEAGINQGTPFAVNVFGNEGLYRTMAELHCPFPKGQGKLRDLQ